MTYKVCLPRPLIGLAPTLGEHAAHHYVCGMFADPTDPLTLDEWREIVMDDRCPGCETGYENWVLSAYDPTIIVDPVICGTDTIDGLLDNA